MEKKIALLFIVIALIGGCAFIRQAQEDKALSDVTPLAEGEASPAERAEKMASIFAGLPYGAGIVAVPIATAILTWFYGSRRGRRIRKTHETSEKPISGNLGKAIGLEWLIQHLGDLSTGILDVGKDGSAAKRTWKATLIAAAGLALYPILGQAIGILQGPEVSLNPIFAAPLVGVLMGAEKWLSKLLPLKSLGDPSPAAGPTE